GWQLKNQLIPEAVIIQCRMTGWNDNERAVAPLVTMWKCGRKSCRHVQRLVQVTAEVKNPAECNRSRWRRSSALQDLDIVGQCDQEMLESFVLVSGFRRRGNYAIGDPRRCTGKFEGVIREVPDSPMELL